MKLIEIVSLDKTSEDNRFIKSILVLLGILSSGVVAISMTMEMIQEGLSTEYVMPMGISIGIFLGMYVGMCWQKERDEKNG